MTTDKPALLLEHDGPVAIITNNDAPINRMTLEFIDALEETLPQLADDASVRAIVAVVARTMGVARMGFLPGQARRRRGHGTRRARSVLQDHRAGRVVDLRALRCRAVGSSGQSRRKP